MLEFIDDRYSQSYDELAVEWFFFIDNSDRLCVQD